MVAVESGMAPRCGNGATVSFSFRPARREGTHLIVGLIGGSGSGKSCSALRLATGLAGGRRAAAIDTEAGRLKHFADDFAFDHGELSPPFAPERYCEAISAADQAGYPVIIVDSMSHVHAGEGGLLDWHDRELDEMVARKLKRNPNTDAWAAREAANISAWIQPKTSHKAMVARLLQLRAHLILCFRAEAKIKITKDTNGKTQVVDAGWQPVCAKGLEFELTASFLLSHERPGLPDTPLKPLPPSLRGMFPPGAPIDETTGRRLAAWASGSADEALRDALAIIGAAGRDRLVTYCRDLLGRKLAEQFGQAGAPRLVEALAAAATRTGFANIDELKKAAAAASEATSDAAAGAAGKEGERAPI